MPGRVLMDLLSRPQPDRPILEQHLPSAVHRALSKVSYCLRRYLRAIWKCR